MDTDPSAYFEGKVALVTGSSSGIGEAIARRLAGAGARVVVNSATSVDAGEALAAVLGDAIYHRADISDEEACRAMVSRTVEWGGGLDILVNNAGFTRVIPHGDLDAVTDEVFRRIFDVNVMGTWYLSRAAMAPLRDSGDGSILNVTSIAGVRPVGSSIPYAMSKAALNHMTRLMANVAGPEVRVNAVAPGLVRTPWTADWDTLHESMSEAVPLARSAEPSDVATTAMGILASRYMTGEIVVLDGGMQLR
ncbi:MAG TPA: SDR family oxidoreductase [Acidimicrobiales bacterium]|nr:SDR family oxidoreductase [Acidimicrobiales bacterium]